MARTKYSYEKRQREIARQKKQEEKRARRTETKGPSQDSETTTVPDEQAVAPVEEATV